MTKELDSTQDAELEDQLIEELSMGMYGRPTKELSALEGLKHARLIHKLLPRLVPFVQAQKITHADTVSGDNVPRALSSRSPGKSYAVLGNKFREEKRKRNIA